MKHLILILLTALYCTCCNAQKDKETTTMKTTERFDVQYYKNKIKEVNGKDGDNSFAIYVDRDSTQVKVYFDKDYDALVTIPPFTYYKEVRIFHKNGVLMESGKRFFCSSIDIGIWREYDNQGNLIKETDEDKKFEKLRLKPINILRWLEHEGYIDRKTGKGQERFVKQGDEPSIRISFGKIGAPNAKFEKDSVLWTITITDKGGDITYTWNAKNGELLSKEILQAIE
ncbi:Uncharacterised protein [Prevotella melaninogenica]|uniref:hypothetical protein n=1 Tax=Prevotella melaninogenica TaxID=28132 RepID=UPI00195DF912|nr:hypothetical protein [Prevotella melaninogenica]VTY11276.1 Uncharacterised protein [Prevotella melaninogenica]